MVAKEAAKETIYAIIRSGGKQYQVREGDTIDVELLDSEIGSEVKFDVLFVRTSDSKVLVGSPVVNGAHVVGELVGSSAGPKITSIKYQPRHNEIRKFGHRQHYSQVRIKSIKAA